jgi:hypothetical protein
VREGSARQIVTAFYLSQRCYWDGERGICAGAVSPAAIADCFGFAERTATRHLTALAALGWCTVEPRPWWYERTFGRWCILNGTWQAPRHPPSPARPRRPRRPVQLFLPLVVDTARVEASAHPTPSIAAGSKPRKGESAPSREGCTAESVDANPPPAAQAIAGPDTGEHPEDSGEILSGAGNTLCKNLSGCTATSSRNDANYSDTAPPNPFQESEEIAKHQNPVLQADPAPPAMSPPLASLAPRQAASGVRNEAGERKETLPAPTLRHILPEDLQDTGRLLRLFDEASRQGLIGTAPADRLTFCALAAHAVRVGEDNPCGLFYRLLHDATRWVYISDADDEAARVRLNTHAYGIGPQRRAPLPLEGSEPPALSEDARFVDLAKRVLGQASWHGDPFLAVKLHATEWTRERWDQAICELDQLQRVWKAPRLVPIEELGMEERWPKRGSSEAASCPECGEEGPACICRDGEHLADG